MNRDKNLCGQNNDDGVLPDLTRAERRQAQALLRQLLPKAREIAKDLATRDVELRPGSVGEQVLHETLRIDNIYGIHIYQGRLGGWFGDLLLKDVPLGSPRRIGTPSAEPSPDRAAAESAAATMLACVAATERTHAERQTPDHAGFMLYGFEILVPRKALEIVKPLVAGDPRNEKEFRARLEELREEFFGDDEPTAERMDALDDEAHARLLTVVTLALLRGYVRWPLPEERGLTV